MEAMKCPNCGHGMQTNKDGDITTEECPDCGGVYLEHGELNAVATGMAGDIEYCSVDEGFHTDRFAQRMCPKCPDSKMEKINLLRLSDVIFDYCPQCGGFYLDKGEVQRMNRELAALTPNKEAQEYRGEQGGHIVRIDRTNDVVQVGYFGISRAVTECFVRVSVFFTGDMPAGVRLFQDPWPLRLAKGLGLHWGQDIETGDKAFDSIFSVHGKDEEAVIRHFDPETRKALIEFSEHKPCIFARHGSIEVTPSAVVYVEGPYVPEAVEGLVEKAQPVVEKLVALADKIEAEPS